MTMVLLPQGLLLCNIGNKGLIEGVLTSQGIVDRRSKVHHNKDTGHVIFRLLGKMDRTMAHPNRIMVHHSKTMVHLSKTMVRHSRTMVHPSRTMVHPSRIMAPHSRIMVHHGRIMVHHRDKAEGFMVHQEAETLHQGR